MTTDLDLERPNDLSIIATELVEDGITQYFGSLGKSYGASFGSAHFGSDNGDMGGCCELAESLLAEARAIWDHCTKVEFKSGYEAE